MIKLLAVLLLLLLASPVAAFEPSEVIFENDYAPGSYRLTYGGIYKLIAAESERFITSKWNDTLKSHYEANYIDYCQLTSLTREIYYFKSECYTGQWWARSWVESIKPPRAIIQISVGHQAVIHENALFSFTNDFQLKWRNIEGAIDFRSTDPIKLGIKPHNWSREGIKFAIAPNVDFSTQNIFKVHGLSLRKLGITVRADLYYKKQSVITSSLEVFYSQKNSEFVLYFTISTVRW